MRLRGAQIRGAENNPHLYRRERVGQNNQNWQSNQWPDLRRNDLDPHNTAPVAKAARCRHMLLHRDLAQGSQHDQK